MTIITTSKVIDVPFVQVKNYLWKLENFENWWQKFNAKFDLQTNSIYFSPLFFTTFQLKLIERTAAFLLFQYENTPFQGTGKWTLVSLENQTKVSYEIAITSTNFCINLFLKSSLFAWKHNRDIMFLIDELKLKAQTE